MTKKIVVVGSSNTDMVIKLTRLPKPGETLLGGDFIMADGGKGANQAVAATRLGGNVTFVARVGSDVFGAEAVEKLAKEGMDTTFVTVDEHAPSGVALIFVDDKGENCIAVASGANNQLSPEDIKNAAEQISDADVVMLQLETPLETVLAAAKIAHEHEVPVILNPAPAQPLASELLQLVSILTPNETELALLTGIEVIDEASVKKAAQMLRDRGVKRVVVTMGAQGSFLLTEDFAGMIPSKAVTATDTTAAGDAFNGALAFTLANGMELQEAVRFANLAGALSATKMGAQPSMPSYNELMEFEKS